MTLYKLIDDGNPSLKKIMNGSKWVGRVYPLASGMYGAQLYGMPNTLVQAETEVRAFRKAVSRALGFRDTDALLAHNARRARRHSRG